MSGPAIAVVGPGGADVDPVLLDLAEEVGGGVARAGATLMCGGLDGVMAAASRGARLAGGFVVGLLPGADRALANADLSVAIPTGMGEMRNALVVRAADAVIAVGGGYGTLSEIALALKAGLPVAGLQTWELRRSGDLDRGIDVVTTPAEAVASVLSTLRGHDPRRAGVAGRTRHHTREIAMGGNEERDDEQRDGAERSGDPAPAGLNDADVPGAAVGSPGGAVLGSPGPGGGGGIPGDADLGGDGDLGGDEDPLRTKTAGGEDSGG